MSTKNFNEIKKAAQSIRRLHEKCEALSSDTDSESYKAASQKMSDAYEEQLNILDDKGIGGRALNDKIISELLEHKENKWCLGSWFSPDMISDIEKRKEYIEMFKNALPNTFLYKNNSTNAAETLYILEEFGIHLKGVEMIEHVNVWGTSSRTHCWKLSFK